ncbi:MAG: hypothetical protein WA919_07190, partial [Coleofasciculaceae cyanobacterium]
QSIEKLKVIQKIHKIKARRKTQEEVEEKAEVVCHLLSLACQVPFVRQFFPQVVCKMGNISKESAKLCSSRIQLPLKLF